MKQPFSMTDRRNPQVRANELRNDAIEDRLKMLESKQEGVPGTVLSRILDSGGSRWSLGIGPMSMPKRFFVGGSIEECLTTAEAYFKDPLVMGATYGK